jgi:hypothetical protein
MREITRASTLRSDTQSYYDAGAGSGTGSSCRGTKKARLNVLNSLLTSTSALCLSFVSPQDGYDREPSDSIDAQSKR